jgi:WD40 repeat protein
MHIKFDESDGEEMEHQATTPAAAVSLPQCKQQLSHKGDYILKVTYRYSDDMIAASTSKNVVKILHSQGGHAVPLADLSHGGRISDVSFTQGGSNMLHSSCADGFIRGFDVNRTPSSNPSEQFQLPNHQEALSFDVLDNLIVAGGQGEVVFFDRRSAASPLSVLEDTHLEDVTSVLLHPTFHHVVSASTDGLIAVHNINSASGGPAAVANDDDSFVAALNPGCSIEQCGFYGPQSEKLWIRTGNETLVLWDWHAATQEEVPGGNEASATFDEARQDSATAAAAAGQVASLFEEVHYLMGCSYDSGSNQLSLIAGTTEGNIGLWPIKERGETPAAILPPAVAFHGAHTDIARSLCLYGPAGHQRYITGGEDGLICLWGAGSSDNKAGHLHQAISHVSLSHGSQPQASFQSQRPSVSQPGSGVKQGGSSGPSRKETKTKSQKFRGIQSPY